MGIFDRARGRGRGGKSLVPSMIFNPTLTSGLAVARGGFTFTGTRASGQSYFDSTGAPQSAANNIFPQDFDPITLLPLGIGLFVGRTNLLLNSLIDGTNLSTQSITTTAATRTLSFYGDGQVVLSGTHSATVAGTAAFPVRTIYTYTPTAGTLTLTVTGAVKYANDELGSSASPFIPTAGSAVARAAPVLSTTDLSSLGATENTFVVSGQVVSVTGVSRTILQLDDGTENNRITLRIDAVGSPKLSIVTGGVSQCDIDAGIVVADTAFKFSARVKNNDCAVSFNGGAVVTAVSTPNGLPVVTTIREGNSPSGLVFNGWRSGTTIYPKGLSDDTLQRLST